MGATEEDTEHVSANVDINDAMSTHTPKTVILDADHNQKQVKIDRFISIRKANQDLQVLNRFQSLLLKKKKKIAKTLKQFTQYFIELHDSKWLESNTIDFKDNLIALTVLSILN